MRDASSGPSAASMAHHGHRVCHRVVQLTGQGLALLRHSEPYGGTPTALEFVDHCPRPSQALLPAGGDAPESHGANGPMSTIHSSSPPVLSLPPPEAHSMATAPIAATPQPTSHHQRRAQAPTE